MRITTIFTAGGLLLVAAGCTYEQRHPGYTSSSYGGQTISAPAYSTNTYSSSTYNSGYNTAGTSAGITQGAVASTSQAFNEADQVLSDTVRQALRNDPTVATYADQINVNANNGAVTLSGSVTTDSDRKKIEKVVKNTLGVSTVFDQLQVSPQPTGSYSSSARVYSGTPQYGSSSGADINSSPSATTLNQAAGNVFNLHVQGLNQPDRNLAQKILQELQTDTIIQNMLPSVNINVSGGQVVLQGRVQSEQQKRSIVSAVERATGGTPVRDELQIAQ